MEKFTFFWHGPFSQWFPSSFHDNGTVYNCAEQFMMAQKAIMFKDWESLDKIMQTNDPSIQKKLGRQVKNFNLQEWESSAQSIVYLGNMLKFKQNEPLLNELLKTEGTTLVEASPYDKIWGIGLAENDSRALSRDTWLGKNLLGQILTKVRESIINERKNRMPDLL